MKMRFVADEHIKEHEQAGWFIKNSLSGGYNGHTVLMLKVDEKDDLTRAAVRNRPCK